MLSEYTVEMDVYFKQTISFSVQAEHRDNAAVVAGHMVEQRPLNKLPKCRLIEGVSLDHAEVMGVEPTRVDLPPFLKGYR